TSYSSLNLPADSIFLYQKSWHLENYINSFISFPSRLSISIINLKSFAHDSKFGFLFWGLLWSIYLYNNSANFKWCVSNFNLERDVLLVLLLIVLLLKVLLLVVTFPDVGLSDVRLSDVRLSDVRFCNLGKVSRVYTLFPHDPSGVLFFLIVMYPLSSRSFLCLLKRCLDIPNISVIKFTL